MDNQTVITIIILLLVVLFTARNSKNPLKKKEEIFSKLRNLKINKAQMIMQEEML